MIEQFICKIDKELLDLNALEMDTVLKRIIPENAIKTKIDELGNKLLNMKNQYFKVKNVDEELFGKSSNLCCSCNMLYI